MKNIFSEYHRTETPNYGLGNILNIPAHSIPTGLTASISKMPVSEATIFRVATERMKAYLQQLQLPQEAISIVLNRLQHYINIGQEPTLKQLLSPSQIKSGLGATRSNLTNDLNNATGGLSDKLISSDPSGTAQAIAFLTTLIPQEIYEKTFGALFANGFNFKCWGATWNPSKAEKIIVEILPAIKQKAAQVLQGGWDNYEKNINAFWVYFYSVRSTERDWLKTSAKDCTKDGLKILIGSIDAIKGEIKKGFEQHAKNNGHTLQRTTTVKRSYPPESHTGRHALTIDVEQYKFTFNSNSTTANNNSVVNNRTARTRTNTNRSQNTANTTRTNTPTINTNGVDLSNLYIDNSGRLVVKSQVNGAKNIPKTVQEAGFGTIAVIALGVLALGTVIMNKKTQSDVPHELSLENPKSLRRTRLHS